MSGNNADMGFAPSLVGPQRRSLSFLVHPALNTLMLAHTFLILLIPLIVSLFYFSTPHTRKQPIFLLNVVAICLAFVVGVLLDILSIHDVLEPLNPLPLNLSIAIGFLGVWESIFVDLILLIRLTSVYPPRLMGMARFILLIATPALLKLARVTNVIIFTAAVVGVAHKPDGPLLTAIIFETGPYLKVEWATQMIDNSYVSIAFLWAIRDRGIKRSVPTAGTVTFSDRLRTLFRIALTNFVLPTLISIAQFISVYRGVNMDILEQLVLVNIMVSTFGVAFATVWAGKVSRGDSETVQESNRAISHTMPIFAKGFIGTTEEDCVSVIRM